MGDTSGSPQIKEDRLARLPDDKRQRILDAAIREFAENGYEKASTNAIVKEAGIAKGLLFHYFDSKKGLYIFALEYAIDFYIDYFLQGLGDLPDDLLDRLVKWTTRKLKLFTEHPLMYRMGVAAMQDVPPDVKTELTKTYARTSERLMPIFLKGLDSSKLRDGIDAQKALQFVMLAFNGITEQFLAAARNHPDKGLSGLPAALKDMEQYTEMLRHGLYRR